MYSFYLSCLGCVAREVEIEERTEENLQFSLVHQENKLKN